MGKDVTIQDDIPAFRAAVDAAAMAALEAGADVLAAAINAAAPAPNEVPSGDFREEPLKGSFTKGDNNGETIEVGSPLITAVWTTFGTRYHEETARGFTRKRGTGKAIYWPGAGHPVKTVYDTARENPYVLRATIESEEATGDAVAAVLKAAADRAPHL